MRIGDLIRKLTPRKVREVMAYSDFDEYSRKVYSQEGEDLLLSRIFDHQPTGFYVDCGAHHPFRFSNTKLLYERGWRGINIEPNPDATILFREHRKRDFFVNLGIGLEEAELTYYQYAHPALNTFDENAVNRKKEKPLSTIPIEVKPLAQILDQFLPKGTAIDLLTIDAEGFDLQILQSNNWTKYTPSYILVESDTEGIDELLKNELYGFLQERGYALTSKLWKSCLFKYAKIEA
jgi:FkbM family methyltransferase